MKRQCGICLYYHAERGDYGTCIATGESISGYSEEPCFTPIPSHLVDSCNRQERTDSVHGIYEAHELPDDAEDSKPSL